MPADRTHAVSAAPAIAETVPSLTAEILRRSFPGVVWSPWETPPQPPAATLEQWTACLDCGTRTTPISALGRDAHTHDLVAVATYCPDCDTCSTLRLAPESTP